MIDSNWMVAPVDVANQNLEDIFYLMDIQRGIQVTSFLNGTSDDEALIEGLEEVLNADTNSTVTFGTISVVATIITKGRVKVLLEQINAGLISH